MRGEFTDYKGDVMIPTEEIGEMILEYLSNSYTERFRRYEGCSSVYLPSLQPS